jgi:hypothetical protein
MGKKVEPTNASKGRVKQHLVRVKEKATPFISTLFLTRRRKIFSISAIVLLVLLILFAIPFTRYGILGNFVKKSVVITVIDSETKKPVSNATVKLGSVTAQSDKDGVAKLSDVPVGQPGLQVEKAYYKSYDENYTIPVIFGSASPKIELVAEGRQVMVKVTNTITAEVLANVVVSSGESKATTDEKGLATLILPPIEETQMGELLKDGYNSADVELPVIEAGKTLDFSITPEGSIYYLSKATGKLNVMQSNIDGTNPTVQVEGTGQESDYETSLLASRDWKYLALVATRTDGKERLYIIDTTTGDFKVIDEGNASFQLVGWSGHKFIYVVNRNVTYQWENKRVALKSYDAEKQKLTIVDETVGSGENWFSNFAFQNINTVYILENEIVYLKDWSSSLYNDMSNKESALISVNPETNVKKIVKKYGPKAASIRLYEPQGIYIRVLESTMTTPAFYEYEDGTIKTVNDTNDTKFNSAYPTYILSPSGKKAIWYEYRDGKNTLLIGDGDGKNAKEIGNATDYVPYGWYGSNDEYILLAKNGSELYIAPANRSITEEPGVRKITNYHKARTYANYGYGYGGQ